MSVKDECAAKYAAELALEATTKAAKDAADAAVAAEKASNDAANESNSSDSFFSFAKTVEDTPEDLCLTYGHIKPVNYFDIGQFLGKTISELFGH